MLRKSARRMFIAAVVCLSLWLAANFAVAAEPPYVIVLRSREAVVTPERTKGGQTGGGFIQVTRLEPNVVMALMRGSAAAGFPCKGAASMQFHLHQDFEIVPTRGKLRPPRLLLAGWLIGDLQSTLKGGGVADHAPACASVHCGERALLNLCVKPHSVAGGENLLVNDRVGPFECVHTPGGYCLDQTFAISVNQPKAYFCPGSTAADFDPAANLDPHWNNVLKPFRAVPHKNFGFRVILRVIEDTLPTGVVENPPLESLPQPRKDEDKDKDKGKEARFETSNKY